MSSRVFITLNEDVMTELSGRLNGEYATPVPGYTIGWRKH
jgi:hypothetical protein